MIAPLPERPLRAELQAAPAPVRANLLLRNDTILGVCEGLGRDLGVPPTLLRIAFAIGLFFNSLAVIGLYLALGIVVALSRWLVPPRLETLGPPASHSAAPQGDNDAERPALAA